ncbi:hypothetical protein RD792_006620 [Penstemon davidsonii]|uniref:glutathione transferase n=1 Tax=Penstemon davidsonii TaxID=160366 RepID=A0ABR0CYQ9_9LAMI|nr:hypothetical protein RD792_012766 [Penstemon davidsonii]KAK4486792.1 hypothetical protein RD792_006620 [Penstemon davidsonii]
MGSDGVKVLGAWPSPFVLRVRIALKIKSVAYEFVEENVLVSKSELLLKSNPVHKLIPVLIHGDKPVCESIIIVEYVDEAWASSGPSILPSHPYDRATARFWAAYLDTKWFPNLRAILLAGGEEARKAALEEVTQGLVWLEEAFIKCSKGQNFFGGEKIGYLDIALGCFLAWLRVVQKRTNASLIDEAKTPNLFKWAQHFSTDSAVKDVLPETDKLMEFAEYLIAKRGGSGPSKVKILGSWTSPFAIRARIAMNIKCVEYELIEENLLSKSDLLLQSNPVYKKVPVLIHLDKPICESLIIVQYIDEVWASGPSILPSDPYDRAIARFWAAYTDDKLFPAIKAILFAMGDEAKKSAALEEASQVLVWLEDAFKKCSKGQKFFGGERIGYIDIALGSYLAWVWVIHKMANASLIDEAKTPNLYKWAQHFSTDDAVKDVLQDTVKLQQFAVKFAANLRASGNK